MYCKYCGKEIADDSTFCKYCGKAQDNTQKGLVNKPFWIVYIIWTLANLYLLIGEKYDNAANYLFPYGYQSFSYRNSDDGFYWNKSLYDFSDFIVYVFVIPAILYVVYRRYNKQIDSFVDKIINKK